MSLEVATYISLALLTALAGVTWYSTPKTSEVSQAKNLAWSKYVEKLITLELDFYQRLNNVYALPQTAIETISQIDIYDGVRGLANHYVEERDKLFLRRDEMRTITTGITVIRQLQIANCVVYVLMMLFFLSFFSELANRWWICFLIWFTPWIILLIFNKRQTRLMGRFDDQ